MAMADQTLHQNKRTAGFLAVFASLQDIMGFAELDTGIDLCTML